MPFFKKKSYVTSPTSTDETIARFIKITKLDDSIPKIPSKASFPYYFSIA